MNKRVLLLVALVATLMAQALPAKACTCIRGHSRDQLLEADGAVIGAVVAERSGADEVEPGSTVYTLRVDEAVKGDLGDTIDVYTDGSTCALAASPGDGQIGLFLHGDEAGRWWAAMCDAISPERLRELAAPLPEPDGRGPARLLAGGSWGEVGHLALDGRGRTLGYGLGNRRVVDLQACAGAPLFVELYVSEGSYVVALRRLRTNELVWEELLPFGSGEHAHERPEALGCRGHDAPEVLVATRPYRGARGPGRVYSYRSGEPTVLYEGALYEAAFTRSRVAYLQRGKRGRNLFELDLATGKLRLVGSTGGHPSGLAVSPNGRRVATFARDRVFVFDLDARARVHRDLARHAFGEVLWMGNDRLVFFPAGPDGSRLRFFDAALSEVTAVRGRWFSLENAVAGRAAYGLHAGSLLRVRLPYGEVEKVRRFDRYVDVLAGVPGDVRPAWPDS